MSRISDKVYSDALVSLRTTREKLESANADETKRLLQDQISGAIGMVGRMRLYHPVYDGDLKKKYEPIANELSKILEQMHKVKNAPRIDPDAVSSVLASYEQFLNAQLPRAAVAPPPQDANFKNPQAVQAGRRRNKKTRRGKKRSTRSRSGTKSSRL
jgi:hypothetical protein